MDHHRHDRQGAAVLPLLVAFSLMLALLLVGDAPDPAALAQEGATSTSPTLTCSSPSTDLPTAMVSTSPVGCFSEMVRPTGSTAITSSRSVRVREAATWPGAPVGLTSTGGSVGMEPEERVAQAPRSTRRPRVGTASGLVTWSSGARTAAGRDEKAPRLVGSGPLGEVGVAGFEPATPAV